MFSNLTYSNLNKVELPSQSQGFKCDYHASEGSRRCTGWILSADSQGPLAMSISGNTYRADNSPKKLGARVARAQCSVLSPLGERCTGEVYTNFREIPEYWFYGAMSSYIEFSVAVGSLWCAYRGSSKADEDETFLQASTVFASESDYQYMHFSVDTDYSCQLRELRRRAEFKMSVDDHSFPYGLRFDMGVVGADYDLIGAAEEFLKLEEYVHGLRELSQVNLPFIFDGRSTQMYKFCSYQVRLWLGIVFMLYGKPAFVSLIDGNFTYDTFMKCVKVVYRSMDGVRRCADLCGACEVCLVHYCEHDMVATMLELVDHRRILRDYASLYERGASEAKKVSIARVMHNFAKIITFDRWATIVQFLMIAPGRGHFVDVMDYFFRTPWVHADLYGIMGGKALNPADAYVYNQYLDFFGKKIDFELFTEGIDFAFCDVRRQVYNVYAIIMEYYEIYHYLYVSAVACRNPGFFKRYGSQPLELGTTLKLKSLGLMAKHDYNRYVMTSEAIEAQSSMVICDIREARAKRMYVVRMQSVDVERMRRKITRITYEGHSTQSQMCVFLTTYGAVPGNVIGVKHMDESGRSHTIGRNDADVVSEHVVRTVARPLRDIVVQESDGESSDDDVDSESSEEFSHHSGDGETVEAMTYRCYVSDYDEGDVKFATSGCRSGISSVVFTGKKNDTISVGAPVVKAAGVGAVIVKGIVVCTGIHVRGHVFFPAHAIKYHESEEIFFRGIGDCRKTCLRLTLKRLDTHIDLACGVLQSSRGVSNARVMNALLGEQVLGDVDMYYIDTVEHVCKKITCEKLHVKGEVCVNASRLSRGQSGGILVSKDGRVIGMYLGRCRFSGDDDEHKDYVGSLYLNFSKFYKEWI